MSSVWRTLEALLAGNIMTDEEGSLLFLIWGGRDWVCDVSSHCLHHASAPPLFIVKPRQVAQPLLPQLSLLENADDSTDASQSTRIHKAHLLCFSPCRRAPEMWAALSHTCPDIRLVPSPGFHQDTKCSKLQLEHNNKSWQQNV